MIIRAKIYKPHKITTKIIKSKFSKATKNKAKIQKEKNIRTKKQYPSKAQRI